MKTKVLVPVILLILAASAAAVWFTVFDGENGPSVTKPGGSTSTMVDGTPMTSVNWKSFENKNIGIGFLVPESYTVNEFEYSTGNPGLKITGFQNFELEVNYSIPGPYQEGYTPVTSLAGVKHEFNSSKRLDFIKDEYLGETHYLKWGGWEPSGALCQKHYATVVDEKVLLITVNFFESTVEERCKRENRKPIMNEADPQVDILKSLQEDLLRNQTEYKELNSELTLVESIISTISIK